MNYYLIDEMEGQWDEYKTYLNKETGETVSVSTEDLPIAEDSEEGNDIDYIEWYFRGRF